MKNIAILGSTGSIGTQTLNVVRRHPGLFGVELLVAGSNADLLVEQALEFNPNAVVIADKSKYRQVQQALDPRDIKVFAGIESAVDLMSMSTVDIVVAAIVGFAGLRPTLAAVRQGKTIALANKETLVCAGTLLAREAREHHAAVLPVDSEHSAIFQCLVGEDPTQVDKLILTASGGPFLGRTAADLASVTPAAALRHPNWNMGAKVTIDSATLMNKGFEVIEAHHLFGLPPEKIDVLVHPQSIVHSMVQFRDGSVKAQIGVPTMETPIQYALTYPDREESHLPRIDFLKHPTLTFLPPDTETFPCLKLAYDALHRGGNIPCAMNAANEVAVRRFLDGSLPFAAIPGFIADRIAATPFIADPSLDDIMHTDAACREQ